MNKAIYKHIEEIKNKIYDIIGEIKGKYSYLIKPFVILFIIYIVAIYPIIRANFNYLDDTNRVILGYRGWKNFSRFTSENLSMFIHTSKKITDISPLPQLIAIFFTTLSSIIILHLFKKNKKLTIANIISVIPIGIFPYFLECLSYKFDSPYMALSVFSCVFPFLFYGDNRKSKIKFSIMIIIGTLIMCTTYQASSGIIPIIALFLAFKLWNNKESKETLKLLIITAISYICGLLIFKLFIMIPVNDYVSNEIFGLKELIPGFINNLQKYYAIVIKDFRRLWLILISTTIILFVFNKTKESKQNKILALIMSILLIIISGLIAFGVYPFFTKTVFVARSMYGIGMLIALICVNITNNKKQYISKLIVIALCWCFFTFSFTYGNALSEQKRYIDFRVQSVVNELNQLEIMNSKETKHIKLIGNAGVAPSIDNISATYGNIIRRLIPQSFGGEWTWHTAYFANYFRLKNITIDYNVKPEQIEGLKVVKDTMYYNIKTNNKDYIVITIK